MKRRKKGWYAGLLCLLLGTFLLTIQAAAASGTLTLCYPHDGVSFAVYRAAERDSKGGYRLTQAFEDSSVSVLGSGWLDTAATLAAYTARDQIKATATKRTDGGSATFDGLDEGLYLVIGAAFSSGSYTDTPVPFLVEIAGTGTVTVHVKYDREYGGGDAGEDVYASYTVEKVWKHNGEQPRPQSVTAPLMRNGKVYESAVLEEANGWRHTWKDLNTSDVWQITEAEVPEGYTVSVSRSGRNFTVTNTWGTPVDPAEPVNPTVPVDPADSVTPTEPDGPRLPQTGQLWWPVILMLCCGAVMLWRGRSGTGGSGKDET